MVMNTLFFTLQHRRSTKTLRVHYGLEGMQYIIQNTSGVIHLNLKKDNDRAKKSYERNGMELIDKTNWTDGDVEVDVYQKLVKKMDIEELELNIDSD